jgi:hypothetical protein
LALKSAVFSIFLFFAGLNWLAWILFAVLSVCFYFKPALNHKRFLWSFSALFACSLIILSKIDLLGYRIWAVIFFGALFFLLLGVKNLAFINRQGIYHIINGFLLLAVFLSFFVSDKSEWFVLKYLLAGLAVYLLSREFLAFFWKENKKEEVYSGEQFILLSSLIVAFLAMEVIWAVALLPIGFLNSSALALAFMLVLQDFLLNYSIGGINPRLILRNITVFALLCLAIFAASGWSV